MEKGNPHLEVSSVRPEQVRTGLRQLQFCAVLVQRYWQTLKRGGMDQRGLSIYRGKAAGNSSLRLSKLERVLQLVAQLSPTGKNTGLKLSLLTRNNSLTAKLQEKSKNGLFFWLKCVTNI